jgi:hypothetical protein
MTYLRINGPLAEFGNRDLPKSDRVPPADRAENKDARTKHKFRLLIAISYPLCENK